MTNWLFKVYFSTVLILVLFPRVNSIRCFVCSGTDTYCKNKRQASTECSTRYLLDTCYKRIPTNYTGELTVTKLCHTRADCFNEQRQCEKSGECSVFCCFTDFCNGSTKMIYTVRWKQKWTIVILQILMVIIVL